MLNSDIADVIIIGAGPAGSRLAWRLARQNRTVILIEKRKMMGESVCCTGLISPHCFNEFGLNQDLIINRFNSARIHSPSGEIAHVKRRDTQAVVVDRTIFDQALMQKAMNAGVQLKLGMIAENIQIFADRVVIKTSQEDKQQEISAKTVVIASGLNQRFTSMLGLGTVRDFAIGVQLEVEDVNITDVDVYLGNSLAPGFFAWMVPTSTRHAKLGMIVRHHPMEHMHRLLTRINEDNGTQIPFEKPVCRPIPLKSLRKTYGDRVLVIGDAAGQVKTTSGGGIYYGLLCADIAADILKEAIPQNKLLDRDLKKYEYTWRNRLQRDMFVGQLARKFLQHTGDSQLDKLVRKTHTSALLEKLLDDDRLSFDWHGPAFIKWFSGVFRA
ncbi:hypothetical protein DGWBC_0890 [Dehalogenimonas sp. WBC-2]|nr:hypothetical protein DGWBC_0890 [Dehalogenimonas sp. WBC-2]